MQGLRPTIPDKHQLCVHSYQSMPARGKGLSRISDLSGAVDVYSDWIDACDAVNKDTAEKDNGHGSSPVGPGTGRRESDADANTNAELGIVDDEEDAEADYEDY